MRGLMNKGLSSHCTAVKVYISTTRSSGSSCSRLLAVRSLIYHPSASLIRDLLYSVPVIPYEVLCMIRVYALYGRQRRVLAALLTAGAAAILFTFVRRLLPAGV